MARYPILFVVAAAILVIGVFGDDAVPAEAEAAIPEFQIRPAPQPQCCPLNCGRPIINPCPAHSTWGAGHEGLQGCPTRFRPLPRCQTCGCFCDPGYSLINGICVQTDVCCPPLIL